VRRVDPSRRTGISFAVTKNRLTMDFNTSTRLGEMVTNALR